MQLIQLQPQTTCATVGVTSRWRPYTLIMTNAIRVWTDRRGKTRFEYGVAALARDPETCIHRGTRLWRGQAQVYAWLRSEVLDLHGGDCGARLA